MLSSASSKICFLEGISCRENGLAGGRGPGEGMGCGKRVFGVGSGVCDSQQENKGKLALVLEITVGSGFVFCGLSWGKKRALA